MSLANRQILLLGFIFGFGMAPISGQQATKQESANGEFAGSNVCKTCHPDVALQFFRNPHYKSIPVAGDPAKTGCEGCHGPGAAHVKAGGGKSTIGAFSLLKPAAILDNCLRCHAKDAGRAHIRRSEHTKADVVCTDCHSVHKPQSQKYLLRQTQSELCYGCHGEVRAQFSLPFKHRVNEGFMSCSDCHNPHGAGAPVSKMGVRPRMVDVSLQNEQPCMKCHVDKRGPFLFEHAAVRVDGCESCHSPHGSANARLLRRPVVFTLCLECHNGAGNFGRQADGIPTQSASHNMADPRYRNCTTCHIRIHGSNAERSFLR